MTTSTASAVILQLINLNPSSQSALETSIKSAPERLKEYSKNSGISEVAWLKIYQEMGLKDISVAVNLCDRNLTNAQVNWIVANERRSKPAIAMHLSNNFNEEQIASIILAKYPKELYLKMLENVSNKKFQGELHKLAGPREYLYYLIRGKDRGLHENDSFDQELIKNTLIKAISISKPSRKLSSVLNFAIERYPFIATEMSESESLTLRTQIASYTKIDNEIALKIFSTSEEKIENNSDEIYPLYALIANPATPLETLNYIESEVKNSELRVRANEAIAKKNTSREEQQKQRIRRAAPSEYRPQGRVFELLDLLIETKDTENYLKVVEAINDLQINDIAISELSIIDPELIREDTILPYTTFEEQVVDNPIFTEPSFMNAQKLTCGNYVNDLTNQNSLLVKLLEKELGVDPSRWEIFLNLVDESDQTLEEIIRIAATI